MLVRWFARGVTFAVVAMGCDAESGEVSSSCKRGSISAIAPVVPSACRSDRDRCGPDCSEVWIGVIDCARTCRQGVFAGCRNASDPRLLLVTCGVNTTTGEIYVSGFVGGIPAGDVRTCTDEENLLTESVRTPCAQ